ncbi:hypothetical protein BU17DRAFT_54767 [Hysterangium stoloniferum]|nr:hypothetical protein BU17DRAFT_54767 [Hysterangium stoloniferum]
MWLRDFLSSDLPHARILSFGYDGYTKKRDQFLNETLNAHAKGLLANFAVTRVGIEVSDRPTIFVAHSFGGIILKFALIFGRKCHQNHLYLFRKVYEATQGILFLRTPHQGTPHNFLGNVVNESDKLANRVTVNSERLREQLVDDLFMVAETKITIKYFYENENPTIFGKELVGRHTADVPGVANAGRIGLAQSHEMLAKFESREEDDYNFMLDTLKRMAGLHPMQQNMAQSHAEDGPDGLQQSDFEL